MSVQHIYGVPGGPQEGTGFPGIGVIDGCELPWYVGTETETPSSLEEKPVFLTAEPHFQLQGENLKS